MTDKPDAITLTALAAQELTRRMMTQIDPGTPWHIIATALGGAFAGWSIEYGKLPNANETDFTQMVMQSAQHIRLAMFNAAADAVIEAATAAPVKRQYVRKPKPVTAPKLPASATKGRLAAKAANKRNTAKRAGKPSKRK